MKIKLDDVLDDIKISDADKEKIRYVFNKNLAEKVEELAFMSEKFAQDKAEKMFRQTEERLVNLCQIACEEFFNQPIVKEKFSNDEIAIAIADQVVKRALEVINSDNS